MFFFLRSDNKWKLCWKFRNFKSRWAFSRECHQHSNILFREPIQITTFWNFDRCFSLNIILYQFRRVTKCFIVWPYYITFYFDNQQNSAPRQHASVVEFGEDIQNVCELFMIFHQEKNTQTHTQTVKRINCQPLSTLLPDYMHAICSNSIV